MDFLRATNEEEVRKFERKFRKIYKQAQEEVEEKLNKYLDGFAMRDRIMYEKVLDGKMTQSDYVAWKNQQIMVGKRWEKLRDELADRYTNANREALRLLGEKIPPIFAESVNYTMFTAEKFSGTKTNFTLYDERTVDLLIRDNPTLLPKPRVKIDKDKKWNKNIITSAVTQGIVQGESMQDIAKRMRGEISKGITVNDIKNSYRKSAKQISKEITRKVNISAIRTARTAVTGAENAGRAQGYRSASDNGIKMQRQWLATLDNRTRHDHRMLDGQIKGVNEPFEIEGIKLDYPADPKAPARMVYNCRCTTIPVINGHAIDLDARDKSLIGEYNDWKGTKEEPKPKIDNADLPELSKIKKTLGKDYDEYYDIINNNEHVKGIYRDYAEEVRAYKKSQRGGYFQPSTGDIVWSKRNVGGNGQYTTLAHEFGHAVDAFGPKEFNVTYGEIEAISAKDPLLETVMRRIPSSSDEYLRAMDQDRMIIRTLIFNDEERRIVNADDNASGLQDFADGLFDTQKDRVFRWGHGSKYYNRKYSIIKQFGLQKDLQEAYKELGFDASNQAKTKKLARRYETASELWANQIAALTVGGKELEYMEKYAPNSLKMLKKLLKEKNKK